MKTIILILFPLLLSSQFKSDWEKFSTKNNAAVHFYASFLVDAAVYHVQSYAFPKWKPVKKIVVSNLVTASVIVLKEVYDKYKANPTGVSKDDIGIGVWAIPIYDVVNICKRDWVGHDVGDAYVKRIELFDSLKSAPKKWSLKRMGFLN